MRVWTELTRHIDRHRLWPPIAAVVGAALMVLAAVLAAPQKTLDRSRLVLTFEETFADGHLDLWSPESHPHGRWKTNLISGAQSGPNAFQSRTLQPNADRQIWVDPSFPGLGVEPLGLDPFDVSQGLLTIKAWPTPPETKLRLWGYPYLAGMISTERSFHQRYGYFEIDAEWPAGRGAHPGFWLLPTDGSWPPELDGAEEIGDTDQAWFTAHFNGPDGKPAQDGQVRKHVNSGDRFTRFGVLWTRDIIAWYQDDRLIRTIRNPGIDKPSYILATFEIGGTWPKDPDASTRWPMRWKIRAIRAYALSPA
jgi:beta-glucanase (GH16 family)